jgi:NAD(P)H dehydrogenase (quinone)
MSKKILVIDAHPDPESFTNCVAEEYYLSAKDGKHEVEIIKVRDLKFDLILHHGYRTPQKMELDLKKAQELITWCEHLVIATPMWWYSVPALFKGFIDRVLMVGFAFKFNPETHKLERLLKGRTARVIYTQGSPKWVTNILFFDSFWKQIKYGVLGFCGLSPVKRTYLAKMGNIKDLLKRQKFLQKVKELGKKGL